jgi:hypothetical protein
MCYYLYRKKVLRPRIQSHCSHPKIGWSGLTGVVKVHKIQFEIHYGIGLIE